MNMGSFDERIESNAGLNQLKIGFSLTTGGSRIGAGSSIINVQPNLLLATLAAVNKA
jgi:hypothetical protein